MIKKIRIKNFKCYGPQGADFNLSKINFIFGDNSAGKSTFLQFLDKLYEVCNLEGKCDSDRLDKYLYKHQEGDISAKLRVSEDCGLAPIVDIWDFKKSNSGEYTLTDSKGNFVGLDMLGKILPVKNQSHFVHVVANRKNAVQEISTPKSSLEKGFEKLVNDELMCEERDGVNQILNRLGVPYSCVIEDSSRNIDRTMIHDGDFDIDLPRSEVGTGIDGLIELAMTLNSWSGGMLALEEPETNVNEEQMAALAKVLVEEALKREKGQLIVECHSKIMALQLVELVRRKQLVYHGNGDDSHLNIFVAQKSSDGTCIKEVKIDTNGDVNWPRGFFPAEGKLLRASYGIL